MANPQVIEYIKKRKKEGMNLELIRANMLASGGWTLEDINEAFDEMASASSKKGHGGLIIFLIILIGLGFAAYKYYPELEPKLELLKTTLKGDMPADLLADISYAQSWETYLNDKFGYSYKYPTGDDSIQKPNIDVAVDIQTAEQPNPDLKTYAATLWISNKEKEENFPNKFLSPLKETTLSGKQAFIFDIDSTFSMNTGDGYVGGYVLHEKQRYIITANQNNDMFIIHYPINDLEQKVASTLVVDTSLLAPKIASADWRTVSSSAYKLSFSYPSNIFPAVNKGDPSTLASAGGNRGSIGVRISDAIFDPENIQGMYGKIEKTEKIPVGNRTGYKYGWGDAGCWASIIELATPQDKTLKISFGSCEEDLYPVASDAELQKEILATFKFN